MSRNVSQQQQQTVELEKSKNLKPFLAKFYGSHFKRHVVLVVIGDCASHSPGAWQCTHIVRFYPARKYVSDSSASDEMMVWFEVANTFRYWTYNFTNFNQRNLRNIFSISF